MRLRRTRPRERGPSTGPTAVAMASGRLDGRQDAPRMSPLRPVLGVVQTLATDRETVKIAPSNRPTFQPWKAGRPPARSPDGGWRTTIAADPRPSLGLGGTASRQPARGDRVDSGPAALALSDAPLAVMIR